MIIYHGATDVGNIRSNNEDIFHISEACHYCLVADGMGGAAAGEVASQIFAVTAKTIFDGHDGSSEADTVARVQTTFKQANENILRHVKHNPSDYGMGCTAELLAFSHNSVIIGHVGDSRTYRLRNNILKQLTKDHSLVQEQLDQGLISPQAARRHSLRNVIVRAVGVNATVTLDILKGRRNPGDMFLLCSDGLTDLVEDSEIFSILTGRGDLGTKTAGLIHSAKAAGGKDNVTIILAAIG